MGILALCPVQNLEQPAVGSVTAGLLLSQMLYWLGKGNDPEGWIYKSQADLYHETGLGRYEQETARKVLRKANVLHNDVSDRAAQVLLKGAAEIQRTEWAARGARR